MKCKFSIGGCCIKAINYILLILCALLFIMLVVVFVQTLCTAEYRLYITREGVLNMQQFWLDYRYIIQALGGCLTLFIVSYNLQKYIDMETVKALGDLRNKLNMGGKKNIHYYLMDNEDKKPILPDLESKANDEHKTPFSNIELFDYLGTIELGAIMVKRKVITVEEFYNQFGYRVENLMNNEAVKKHIIDNPQYYKMFRFIVNELVKDGYISKCP